MAFDFTGQTILVTGASRGIGRELTKALIKAGAVVYGLARNKDLLDILQQECGEHFKPIVVDVSDWDATRAAIEVLPVMDGLVNNAGVFPPGGSALQMSKDLIQMTFDVNVWAPINIIQIVGSKMVSAGKKGSIVNVSSIAGLKSVNHSMHYCLSKAAMDMVTRQFAAELGPSNIRVNSANPTIVYTDMGNAVIGYLPDKGATLLGHTPMGRYMETEDAVGPILYLLSDHSSMVTGTTNIVDGGLLCYTKA